MTAARKDTNRGARRTADDWRRKLFSPPNQGPQSDFSAMAFVDKFRH
jgi:hypothetical protein